MLSGRAVLLCAGLASALACDEGPLPKPAFIDDRTASGLCLAQIRSNRIEEVRVDAARGVSDRRLRMTRTVVGPNGPVSIDDGPSLSWGQVAPDGSYVAATDGDTFIGVTLASEPLWNIKTDVHELSISTDSTKIVMNSRRSTLAIYDVVARDLKPLNIVGNNPSLAPANDRIAYDDGRNTHIHDLLNNRSVDLGVGTEPSWSTGGNSVAVRAASDRIELIELGSRRRTVLVDDRRYVSVPRWSPDGKWLTYNYRGPRHWWSKSQAVGSEPHQIVVRDLKTGSEASVGQFFKANPGHYEWVANADFCALAP